MIFVPMYLQMSFSFLGPGLEVESSDQLFGKFPWKEDAARNKLVFQPLMDLNCSQYDMTTGIGIRSAFNQLAVIVKEEIQKENQDPDEGYFVEAISYNIGLLTFCEEMEKRFRRNKARNEAETSSKQKAAKGADSSDGLHHLLVPIIESLIKLSISSKVRRKNQIRIR